MTTLTEKQKKALELKGNHKIYFEDDTRDNQKFLAAGEIDKDRFEEIKNVLDDFFESWDFYEIEYKYYYFYLCENI